MARENYERKEKMSGWLTKRDVIYLPLASTLDLMCCSYYPTHATMNLPSHIYTPVTIAYDEYNALLLSDPFSLDGHDDICWEIGEADNIGLPFFSILALFTDCLVSDQRETGNKIPAKS